MREWTETHREGTKVGPVDWEHPWARELPEGFRVVLQEAEKDPNAFVMSARYRGVTCPKCGAKPGESCLKTVRLDARHFRSSPQEACHRARIKAWMGTQHKGEGEKGASEK